MIAWPWRLNNTWSSNLHSRPLHHLLYWLLTALSCPCGCSHTDNPVAHWRVTPNKSWDYRLIVLLQICSTLDRMTPNWQASFPDGSRYIYMRALNFRSALPNYTRNHRKLSNVHQQNASSLSTCHSFTSSHRRKLVTFRTNLMCVEVIALTSNLCTIGRYINCWMMEVIWACCSVNNFLIYLKLSYHRKCRCVYICILRLLPRAKKSNDWCIILQLVQLNTTEFLP